MKSEAAMISTDVYARHIREAEAMTNQQLHVRIACEQELIEWREAQIRRLQAELEDCTGRLFAAAAVLYIREES